MLAGLHTSARFTPSPIVAPKNNGTKSLISSRESILYNSEYTYLGVVDKKPFTLIAFQGSLPFETFKNLSTHMSFVSNLKVHMYHGCMENLP